MPLEWKDILTSGQDPPPRYSHTMTYSEEQNTLVVFGGRCDFAGKKTNFQQILNDIWILFIENLTWYKAHISGSVPRERFSHAACIVTTTLLIVGGINAENFLPADLYSLEMDPYHQKRIKAEEQLKVASLKTGIKNRKLTDKSIPYSMLIDD